MSATREPARPDIRPLAWVTGAGGLIGNYLVRSTSAHAPRWRVRPLTRDQLDLTDFEVVRRLFDREQPQLIIHCAAMSKSPQCEADPERARRINVDLTQQLAELGSEIPFVFFSSDLVFDGKKGNY